MTKREAQQKYVIGDKITFHQKWGGQPGWHEGTIVGIMETNPASFLQYFDMAWYRVEIWFNGTSYIEIIPVGAENSYSMIKKEGE